MCPCKKILHALKFRSHDAIRLASTQRGYQDHENGGRKRFPSPPALIAHLNASRREPDALQNIFGSQLRDDEKKTWNLCAEVLRSREKIEIEKEEVGDFFAKSFENRIGLKMENWLLSSFYLSLHSTFQTDEILLERTFQLQLINFKIGKQIKDF